MTLLARQVFLLALGPVAMLLATLSHLRAQDTRAGYSIVGLESDRFLYLEERGESVTISVHRSGDSTAPGTVHYRVTATAPFGTRPTATANADFSPTEGTLTFGPGDTRQTFNVLLIDDTLIEGDEDFFIVLDQATGGVPIQTPEVQVILRDNEHHPVRLDPAFQPTWRTRGQVTGWAFPTVQPEDGKILLVTAAEYVNGADGTVLVRLLPDGKTDPTWQVPTIGGIGSLLALQDEGKVLVAASDQSDPQHRTTPDFLVNGISCRHLARFDTNGILDMSFSADLPTNAVVSGLSVQRDGLVLAAVRTIGMNGHVLFRLNATGSRDLTFKPASIPEGETVNILQTPDGGILVTGHGGAGIVRLHADGSRDANFHLPPNTDCWLQAVETDGRILALLRGGDWEDAHATLVRLSVRGEWDASFTPIPPSTRRIRQVLPTSGGKIWIFSTAPASLVSFPNWVLRRLNADGSEDPSWPIAQFRGDSEELHPKRLMELPDGNLLYASTIAGLVNGQPRRGLARLLVNAPQARIELDPTTACVPESGGKVLVKLLRCGNNTEPLSVIWQTSGGTARPGVDYVPSGGTLSFPAHQSVALLELEVFDNAVPDEDRTVTLRLESPLPERRAYPQVDVTLVNDDLGFLPNGITPFPNGRVLLRPAPLFVSLSHCSGCRDPRYVDLLASDNLPGWTQPDLEGGQDVFLACPEVIDKTAPSEGVRFYKLRNR